VTRTFDIERIVTLGDTNFVGNAYFATFIKWQGECREEFLIRHVPGFASRLNGDHTMATVSCSCEYLAEVQFLDGVQVRMSVSPVHFNLMTLHFDYYRVSPGSERLVARGEQVIACVRRSGEEFESAAWPAEALTAAAGVLGADISRAFAE
jgi:enediyne biosynthesis thioesterase